MTSDSITWGETYGFNVAGSSSDDGGEPFLFDGTYSATVRVCVGAVGGPTLVDVPLTLVDGVFVGEADTGDEPWVAGEFYFDARITDGDGNDYWTEPTRLILNPRCAPPSTEV